MDCGVSRATGPGRRRSLGRLGLPRLCKGHALFKALHLQVVRAKGNSSYLHRLLARQRLTMRSTSVKSGSMPKSFDTVVVLSNKVDSRGFGGHGGCRGSSAEPGRAETESAGTTGRGCGASGSTRRLLALGRSRRTGDHSTGGQFSTVADSRVGDETVEVCMSGPRGSSDMAGVTGGTGGFTGARRRASDIRSPSVPGLLRPAIPCGAP